MKQNYPTGPRLPKTPEQAWERLYEGALPEDWRTRLQAYHENMILDEIVYAAAKIELWVKRCASRDQVAYDLECADDRFEDGEAARSGWAVYRARLDPDSKESEKACFHWRVWDRGRGLPVTHDLQRTFRRTVCLPKALQGKMSSSSAKRERLEEPA